MKAYLIAGLATGLTLPAAAKTLADPTPVEQSNQDTYTPADFEQFAPRTALDMVREIPGFSISNNDDARGFGQAQENVLINGKRISSKSTGARETLSRIPAANVVRIEIVEGASLDIPGLSGQVANIVSKASGLSGTWTYRQRYRENLPPAFDWFEVNVSGEAGNLEWNLGLESEPGRGANAGRASFTDGQGLPIEYHEEDVTHISARVTANGNLSWTSPNGAIANLNAEYTIFEYDQRETSNRFQPDGTEFRRLLFQFAEDEWNSELSGDYEFGLGPGRLKLIGLQRWEHSPTISRAFGGELDGSELFESVFERTVDESESILRGEYSWQATESSDWQVSLEAAFNSLDSEAALFEGSTFGALSPVDLGDPNIRVEEKRAEAFITHGRQLTPTVRLQASLGAEQSEIMSDGANGQTRTFTRPKGSLSLAWEAAENLTWNAQIERKVGQLNFFDFVSNVDLNQGDDQQGNVNIVPSQRWRAELGAERDFGDWGAVTVSLFGESIEDLTDLIPIGSGEGPGNIDTAERYGLEFEGTLKLDKIGWQGAQLDYEAFLQDTFVDDPLTGITRDFNGSTSFYYEFNFRHDIPGTEWALGLNYETFRDSPVFRRGVRRYYEQPQGFAWGFIEHKDLWGMTGSIFVANLLDSDDNFQRIEYTPDRTGTISQIENRTANFGPILTFRLKGSF